MDPKIGGLLSYLLFGWIGGLTMFFTQKHPELRFHGAQSVLVSIALFALFVGLSILGTVLAFVPVLGWLASLFSLLLSLGLGLGVFVLWVFLCIKGYNLDHFKLPVIGDMAEGSSSPTPAATTRRSCASTRPPTSVSGCATPPSGCTRAGAGPGWHRTGVTSTARSRRSRQDCHRSTGPSATPPAAPTTSQTGRSYSIVWA